MLNFKNNRLNFVSRLKRSSLFFGLFLTFQLLLKAQDFGIGISGIYNFQTESMGIGARALFRPDEKWRISPQVAYFPSFNKVHEIFAGCGLEYRFMNFRKFHVYGLAHGGYNNWLSYSNSSKENAAMHNWNLEGGIGISGNQCWRPFAEYRYNVKYLETHLSIGLIYIFGCHAGADPAVKCPAYF